MEKMLSHFLHRTSLALLNGPTARIRDVDTLSWFVGHRFTSVCLVPNCTTDAGTMDLVARVDRPYGCVHGDKPRVTGKTAFYSLHEVNIIV